jgi:penicillin-binding protein 1A
MGDSFHSLVDEVLRFADRHMRAFAIVVALIAVPLSLIVLTPVALEAAVPVMDRMPEMSGQPATFTFLDADGRMIGRRGPVAGEVLRFSDMPAYLPAAFLAMEDRRFYRHHGVDFIGLARAAYTDLRAHRVVAGGSSISQQTAKLVFDQRQRTFSRKLRELVNTAELEKSFSKPKILELYLNRIYLGSGAYGVDTAARTYFGVSARHVSLAQAAMLAALTRAPSVFSPRRDLALAQQRAARVLTAMVYMGAIRPDQAGEAIAHPATVIARPTDTHSYFLDAAAEEARRLADHAGPGALIVHTTLRSDLQAAADRIAADAVSRMGRKLNFSQVAMVAMKPDGAVAAMVGGVNYARSVFNRTTQARRQPGSAFKPFVYLAALEAGLSPWDWRDDRAVDIAGYQPANYKDAHYGRLRLTDALARSVNTITVNLAQEIGIPKVAAAAKQAGITSPLQNNASLALGTNEVTPLELTAAYATFANGGERAKPYLVSRIETADGKVIYERQDAPAQPVIADTVRRDLNAMLYNVITSGTGTAARLPDREAAGKTGTTQDYRDAWFVGFTADYVASVWLGNDDDSPMHKVTGGLVPAALWKEVMTAAEQGLPPRPLDRTPEPANVSDSFAEQQVSYVDDVDAATPQLSQDQTGDFVSGSGVTPERVVRKGDDRSDGYVVAPQAAPAPSYAQAPQIASSYPHMTSSSPPPEDVYQPPRQDPSDAQQAAKEMSDFRRWLQTRPPQAGRDMEPAPQTGPTGENPYYSTRRTAEAPPAYGPWSQTRPMPYQAYRDRADPPYPYYSAPRTYDPAPPSGDPRYGDRPDRYSDR